MASFGARALHRFTESVKRSKLLFCRNSRRKTGSHFSWNRSVARHRLAGAGDWCAGLSLRNRALAAFIAGAFSALGFAPLELFPLLLAGYGALLLLLDGAYAAGGRRVRGFAFTGWAFGFGQFLVGLYWIGNAFMVDAAHHAWQIPFVELLLPGGLALFPALACVAALGLWQSGSGRIVALSMFLALGQWLRGHVLTGFPWNLAAYGWGAVPGILQSAAAIGAYGLSFLTILLGTSLAAFFSRRKARAWILPSAMLVLFALLWAGGALRMAQTPEKTVPGVRLRIVQPNIPEREKFDPRYVARNWQRLVALSLPKSGPLPTHIIWPESAPPFVLTRSPRAMADVAFLTGTSRVLMTGAIRLKNTEKGPKFYNSFYIFGPGGTQRAVYDKFHLVPFGEYMPLASFFSALGIDKLVDSPGGFSAGDGPHTYAVPGAPKVGPLICYEIIFPDAVVGNVRPGWLVNVTNDSWFGTWAGPHQHLLIARVRAIEEGLPIVRAAGTGISAVIDPLGRITTELGMDRMGAIQAPLPAALAATPYARHGDLFFAIMVVVSATISGWWLSRK